MATIADPESLVKEIEDLRREGWIASAEEFAEQAIREKLSAARRDRFALETEKLQQDLSVAGLTSDRLLREFERFRHAAHADR
ncbi:MAG: hypothetical protein HY721_27305 [Planctomycetes bacterium]|nr:hypothetical protein [Planctomycetota bacterium]